MFYSLAIPGILQARPVGANPVDTLVNTAVDAYSRERVPASVEKSMDGGADASSNDDALTLTMLYEQFRRPIHSYIYRLLGNQEDADDVTQEVFVRACTSWNGLYERAHLSPWLYRIATNLCVDALRRRKRISWWPLSQRFRNDDSSDEATSDDTSVFLSDSGGIPEIAEREHIRLALANMPEEYAIALVLSAAQGVPYQEIATIMGVSPNAAATRISRAKRMFVERYQRLNSERASEEPGVKKMNKDSVGKQEKLR